LLDLNELVECGHFTLIITEAGLFNAWKWINTLEALRRAGVVLFGAVPGIHGVVVGHTFNPCGRLVVLGLLLHEVNVSITRDWLVLFSSFVGDISWLILTEALLVNSRIKKVFLQSHSRVGALEIVSGLFLDMDPFSKFIESSNWIFGDWVVFDTVVKSTWTVASVGS